MSCMKEYHHCRFEKFQTLKTEMRNTTVSVEVKELLHTIIVLPTHKYERETLTLLQAQISGISGMEMSYMRSVCSGSWRHRWTTDQLHE